MLSLDKTDVRNPKRTLEVFTSCEVPKINVKLQNTVTENTQNSPMASYDQGAGAQLSSKVLDWQAFF